VTDKIKVLVVDDIAETTAHVTRLLSFESDMEVVGTAATGTDAIRIAREVRPDVILMDVNMPGLDGIETTERLSRELPSASTIMMSVQADGEYLRRSMLAGARGYLVKPFSSEELFASTRAAFARRLEGIGTLVPVGPGTSPASPRTKAQIVAVYSPKGGVGTTTIAVNLAVALAAGDKSVALVDADLQFGDVGVMLNLDPTKASVGDVVADLVQGTPEALDGVLVRHRSNVDVLLAPPTPDTGELLTPEHMKTILGRLSAGHDFVVVDCPTHLNDATLAVLDMADRVLCAVSLEITAIRTARTFVDVSERIGYPDGKLAIIVNRADSNHGISIHDVERSIGRPVEHTIVSDGRSAVQALNHGIPFVMGNRKAQITIDYCAIAEWLEGPHESEAVVELPKPRVERRLAFARR
jgi:pilus assembly protein CpaE